MVLSNGSVVGFGHDYFVLPEGLPPVEDAVTGESYVATLLVDGTLRMWGRLRQVVLPTELGVPRSQSPLYVPQPLLKAVSFSVQSFMALTADNQVFTWGADNGVGQFNVPALNARDPALRMAAGYNHSLLLLTSGRVVSFGLYKDEDVPDAARTNVTHISAGWGFSVAVREDGGVLVWGNDSMIAECGLVTGMPDFPSLAFIQDISAGGRHVLALLSDGSVRAWGCNEYMQATLPDILVSVNTSGVRVVAVAAGATHSLALMSDGSVRGWGDSSAGRVGDVMSTLTDVAGIAAGVDTSVLYRTSSNALWVYGPTHTQLPPAASDSFAKHLLPLPEGTHAVTIAASRWNVIALLAPAPAHHTQGAWPEMGWNCSHFREEIGEQAYRKPRRYRHIHYG
jgi:alpha-tubulin suppressor-like RCC1 family protein